MQCGKYWGSRTLSTAPALKGQGRAVSVHCSAFHELAVHSPDDRPLPLDGSPAFHLTEKIKANRLECP